jgi:outer membrane protein OmpA-like peptidoglycan-associated protein
MSGRRSRLGLSLSWVATATFAFGPLVAGCAQGPVLRGRVKGLESVVAQAEKNGAVKCAPRELALARSHLEFASVDLSQGQMTNAEAHLEIAEPNANAALAESPPDKCSERGFSEPGDRDGDGYPDADDACPDQPETWNGFDDNDGCPDDPDTDNDRVTDSHDMCVVEPEDRDGYLDDDGCPDLDNDSDGIADALDKCPNQPEDIDGWQDDDGCPDPDNDGDSVLDLDDFCPNTPGPATGARPGCPDKNQLVVLTAREIRILKQIQFAFNKSTIVGKVSFTILDEVADVLQQHNELKVEIQGHTDNVGNAAYNLKLSQARADAVRKYLVGKKHIAADRLTSKGYGSMQPLVSNLTEENRQINRRVQFVITQSQP